MVHEGEFIKPIQWLVLHSKNYVTMHHLKFKVLYINRVPNFAASNLSSYNYLSALQLHRSMLIFDEKILRYIFNNMIDLEFLSN